MGSEEHVFEYDVTTTEADEHGRACAVAWYKELE
jgi:hypothetical protein